MANKPKHWARLNPHSSTQYAHMHAHAHTHTRTVRRTPKGGRMQMSALFGIFVANLSLGKSEGLAGV